MREPITRDGCCRTSWGLMQPQNKIALVFGRDQQGFGAAAWPLGYMASAFWFHEAKCHHCLLWQWHIGTGGGLLYPPEQMF